MNSAAALGNAIGKVVIDSCPVFLQRRGDACGNIGVDLEVLLNVEVSRALSSLNDAAAQPMFCH